jgi:hypothetical protein
MKPRFSIQPSTNKGRRGNVRPLRVIQIDDEPCFGELAELIIKHTFHEAVLITFQDSDKAWTELQRSDPDPLITDMNNTNVPGRNINIGMGGWRLLPLSLVAKSAQIC